MADATAPVSAIRTIVVRSPDRAQETQGVVQSVVVIAIAAILLGGLRRGGDEAAAAMNPYQVLFRDQPSEIQRLYSALISDGLEEAIRMRTPQDEWPPVVKLAESFVAPFVQTPGLKPEYRWECRRRGDFINYLGRPAEGSGRPTFLLLIQENFPHLPNTPLDEFHRRLPDGSFLHVGVWFHRNPRLAQEPVWMPDREGWTEVMQGTQPLRER